MYMYIILMLTLFNNDIIVFLGDEESVSIVNGTFTWDGPARPCLNEYVELVN